MKMSKRAREALEGSIKKWGAIRAGTGEDHGGSNCPLCTEIGCGECPVAEIAVAWGCDNTPYAKWTNHQDRCHNDTMPGPEVIRCPTCSRLAREELEFLVGLR